MIYYLGQWFPGAYRARAIALCVALLSHSPFRVVGLVAMAMLNPLLLSSFWCLPSKFLSGTSAAAGIALINAIGSTGGFVGPLMIGYLKQATGGDGAAFFTLAGITFSGAIVCLRLRQTTVFRPARVVGGVALEVQRA